ncbi:MAG: hypothetical protein MI755_00015 [Sphingomonadales bacterium]|nr:hypothetical protein [Sphingomonadales bacterium]
MTTIGLLSPNLVPAKLEDARRILPSELELIGYGFPVRRYSDSEFAKVADTFLDNLEQLAGDRLDFLMVTGELFFAHLEAEHREKLLREISSIAGCPASTVVKAVMNAFNTLGVKRIVLATPFVAHQTDWLQRFLTDQGMDVVGRLGLGHESSEAVWQLPPETGYAAAAELLSEFPEADGVYLPNNQWRVTSVIDRIERDFGKPVVANTPAWIKEAITAVGQRQPITGYGKLLML